MIQHYTAYDISTPLDINSIICFDIETTSYFFINGMLQPYLVDKKDPDYVKQLNECPKGAIVWIWQISINGQCYYGRDIAEFAPFLQKICCKNKYQHLTVWVHNLAFEFQFLREYLNVSGMFARTVRKPMKFDAVFTDTISCTFRCTYMLTRLSLENWAKKIGSVEKQSGTVDYNVLRTPYTPVSEIELTYCEYDVYIIHLGIRQFLHKYESINDIPLTQTGEVRNVIKQMYSKNNAYKKKVTKLQPHTRNEYNILKAAFGGGDTHAVACNAGQVLQNIGSFDLTSDYPSQMCKQKYPMTRFKACSVHEKLDTDNYAYIIMAVWEGVESITPARYIARSRCVSVSGGTYDNGRVIKAKKVVMCTTEQDYKIMYKTYKTEKKTIIKLFKSKKGYLDKDFIIYILELFANKTSLKGVVGMEDLYMQSKQFINSLFGMCVTDLLQPDISYDNSTSWDSGKTDVNAALAEIQKKFYKNILAYQWGVWVTAYARSDLWAAILHIDTDCVYYDTDSCKIKNPAKYIDFFKERDSQTVQMLQNMCTHYNIDMSLTCPKTPDGLPQQLGVWDYEADYKQFITLGAKRYCYTDDEGLHITVAGVPKKAAKTLKDIYEFCDGFEFGRDESGKRLLYYLDGNTYQCTMPDGYKVTQQNSVCMRNNGYDMTVTNDYKTLINYIAGGKL